MRILLKNTIFLLGFTIMTLLLRTAPVFADALMPGTKTVAGFVKFEGWEKVADYILVQPEFTEWDDCNQRINFHLINDGDLCNFGSENHC